VDTLENREIIKILTKIINISNHNSHCVDDAFSYTKHVRYTLVWI
jgi:hypothetical protein